MKKLIITILAIFILPSMLFAITAEEIIQKLEKNTIHDTMRAEGTLTINDNFGSKTSSYIS